MDVAGARFRFYDLVSLGDKEAKISFEQLYAISAVTGTTNTPSGL